MKVYKVNDLAAGTVIILLITAPVLFLTAVIFIFSSPYVSQMLSIILLALGLLSPILCYLFAFINAKLIGIIPQNRRIIIKILSVLILIAACTTYYVHYKSTADATKAQFPASDPNDNNLMASSALNLMTIFYILISIFLAERIAKRKAAIQYI